jgi:hypothetical protein
MKKYTMLSAVWLLACGAGAGQQPQDDSTLQSPLTADDDDGTDPTERESTSGTGDTGGTEAPEGSDGSDGDGPGGAVRGGTFPAEPCNTAPATAPTLVIGAGGTAWTPPQSASVVWCNVDVPIGCPAISPSPEGGRLVVVHAMTDAGGAELGASESASASEAGFGSAGEAEFASAGEATINAGDAFVVYATPVTAGAAPSTEVPVIIGGSLPPLPGTCVAVTFAAGGEPVGAPSIAGGPPNAGGESASVPADVSPLPSPPPAPGSGPATAGASANGAAGASASGAAGVSASGAAGASANGAAGASASGAAGVSASGAAGVSASGATLPALPPPGECLGVTFPATRPGYPAVPAQPVADGEVAPVPAAPAAGTCVDVAFATSADPNQPRPSRAPVMCALPVTSPVSGVAAAPSAGNEPAPVEDVR